MPPVRSCQMPPDISLVRRGRQTRRAAVNWSTCGHISLLVVCPSDTDEPRRGLASGRAAGLAPPTAAGRRRRAESYRADTKCRGQSSLGPPPPPPYGNMRCMRRHGRAHLRPPPHRARLLGLAPPSSRVHWANLSMDAPGKRAQSAAGYCI